MIYLYKSAICFAVLFIFRPFYDWINKICKGSVIMKKEFDLWTPVKTEKN